MMPQVFICKKGLQTKNDQTKNYSNSIRGQKKGDKKAYNVVTYNLLGLSAKNKKRENP